MIFDSKALPELRTKLHEKGLAHKTMIIGGVNVGFYLAGKLERTDLDLKLIEISQPRCQKIVEKLSKTMILNVDGTDISLLQDEGAVGMDAVFALRAWMRKIFSALFLSDSESQEDPLQGKQNNLNKAFRASRC